MAGMKSGISLTVIWNIFGWSLQYRWILSGISLTGALNIRGWNLERPRVKSGIYSAGIWLEYPWLESRISLA